MKRYILLFALLLSLSGYAQNTINNYKFVVVPEKFSFLKEADQYRLNTLSKMILEDKGFTVYMDNPQLPDEIASNKCNALNFDVLEKNTMFSTNLTVVLKDCKNNILFKSTEGRSKEKDYKVSYNLALRAAFESLNSFNYVYTAPATATTAPAQPAAAVTIAVAEPLAKAETSAAVTAPASSPSPVQVATVGTRTAGTLYAQPTANGYQLIDTTPKIILTLFRTSVEGYFIAENGSSNGMVFKKDGNWVFEYYKAGKLVADPLSIKF